MMLATALLGSLILGCAACNPPEAPSEEPDSPAGDVKTYTVYAPDGAPALSLCNSIAKTEGDLFEYHIVDSSTIQTYVTGETPTADFCVLPVNLASKLLGTGTTYQMLGTVTNGNMYFLTTNGETLTKDNLTSLVGKTVGVVQLPNVPGLTLRAVLDDYSVPYSVLGNDTEAATDKVNLKAVDAATGVTPAGGCDYYLCPEPAASTKVAKTNGALKFAGDLQQLYGEGGYPQAVLVAKKSVIAEDSAAVQAMVSDLEGSASYLASADPATVVTLLDGKRTEGLTPSFTAENLTAQVIANSSVRFTSAQACKEKVNAFLAKLIAINAEAAKNVADGFFYEG